MPKTVKEAAEQIVMDRVGTHDDRTECQRLPGKLCDNCTDMISAIITFAQEQRQRDAEIASSFMRKRMECNCASVDIGVGIQHEPTCGMPTPEDIADAILKEPVNEQT